MGFSNGISEPLARSLGECPLCQTPWQTRNPYTVGISTTPCPSCDADLCAECPTRECAECGEKVCIPCVHEHPEADGWICRACIRRSLGLDSIDGYTAEEYAERQTNILSGIEEEDSLVPLLEASLKQVRETRGGR